MVAAVFTIIIAPGKVLRNMQGSDRLYVGSKIFRLIIFMK